MTTYPEPGDVHVAEATTSRPIIESSRAAGVGKMPTPDAFSLDGADPGAERTASQPRRVTRSAQLTLSTMKSLAGRGGKVTITHQDIMTKHGVDKSTVTRSIRALIDGGYIERVSGTDGKVSVYRVFDKPVPVSERPSTVLSDGCDPKSDLERHVHDVLTEAGIPHLHDVPYKLVHPDWIGDERCDFLIGHNSAVEVGRELFSEYSAGRERKRQEARRLKMTLADIHDKVGATNYFAANGSYRLNAHPPTEGLEDFIIRIAGLPHPALAEFIARCRVLEARQRELDLMDDSPKPPKGFKDWNVYNAARAETDARAKETSFSLKGWIEVPPSAEELARRAERDKLEAERKAGRDYWGDLLEDDGDGGGGTPVAPVRTGQEAAPDPDGQDEPTDDDIEQAERIEWEHRLEYGSDNDDEWDNV